MTPEWKVNLFDGVSLCWLHSRHAINVLASRFLRSHFAVASPFVFFLAFCSCLPPRLSINRYPCCKASNLYGNLCEMRQLLNVTGCMRPFSSNALSLAVPILFTMNVLPAAVTEILQLRIFEQSCSENVAQQVAPESITQ